MAQQTMVKRAATVAEKTAGRASKPRAKARKAFDYSKFRQSLQDEKDFAAYLAGYPDKTGILAYVYRLKPMVDNSLAGIPQSYIDKIDNPANMTRDYLAAKHGCGKYMLKFSDANAPKNEQERCKTWFTVDDPDLKPIYDICTLKLGERDNQDEVARLLSTGELVRDAATGAPRLRTQADAAGLPAEAASTPQSNGSGDLVSKDIVNTLLMKVINAGSQSPNDTMKQAIDIAKLLQPSSSPQLNVEQIAELVAAKLERTSTKVPGDGDFFQTYERVEAFIQKVKGPAPVAMPEGTSGWVTILGSLLERVDRWIPAIVTTLQQRQAPRRVTGRRQQPPAEGEQPQPTVAERIEQIAILGFQKMSEGIHGFDFAAYVCNYMQGGLEIYQMLEPSGPPGVMGLCAMNPKTAPLLSDPAKRAQIESFLSDFFSYDPSGTGGGEVVESAAAAAA
jgi:hypothetical protein